jgi:dipeptidyl aminopeptidase/acylaminoacyl peptidase
MRLKEEGSMIRRRILAAAAQFLLVAAAHAATAAPPAAALFGSLPRTQQVALSPNGRLVAFDVDTGGARRIAVVDVDSGKTIRTVGLDASNKLRWLTWGDDETVLAEASVQQEIDCSDGRRCKVEWFRTVAIRTDGAAPVPLLNTGGSRRLVSNSNVHAVRPGLVTMSTWAYSEGRQKISTGSHQRQSERDMSGWVDVVYEVDTRKGNGRVLATGTQYTSHWIVDGEGQPVARSEWDPTRQIFAILARRGDRWTEILRRDDGRKFRLAGLDPAGKNVIALGADGGPRSQAWALPLDGSPARILHASPDFDVDWYEYDWNRNVVIGVGARLGGQAHWLDSRAGAQSRAMSKAFPGQQVSIVDRSADAKRVLVRVSGGSSPSVYHLVDFERGKADIVAEQYPALAQAQLGTVRYFDYPARDGSRIPAYLTLPPGAADRSLPLVVLPHGGPESSDDDEFDWLSQFLATRGYAVLRPQFRGSTGYGEQFRLAGYRQWGLRMQDDLTDGVAHLVSEGLVDPKKVCIVGASYGGYAALAGAAFTPDLYACAVSIAGISDLPAMINDLRLDHGDDTDSLYYWYDHIGPPSDPNVVARSPARNATAVAAPVLLIHGIDDSVVRIRQSELMWRALDQLGKPVTFVRLDGEDHWLSREATRQRVLQELEAFLGTHLR